MRVLLERTFVVDAPAGEAWRVLADVRAWPAWAPHILGVALDPDGPLGPSTRGRFRLRGAPASSWVMAEFDPPRHWSWVGSVAGMRVVYDHVFEPEGPEHTRIRFVLVGHGSLERVVGGLFAWLYGRNLDLAIPRLIARFREGAAPG
jgi:hypothetical protein